MAPRKPKRRPGRKGTTVPLEDGGPQDPAQASLVDKLRVGTGGGPVTFTGEERAAAPGGVQRGEPTTHSNGQRPGGSAQSAQP